MAISESSLGAKICSKVESDGMRRKITIHFAGIANDAKFFNKVTTRTTRPIPDRQQLPAQQVKVRRNIPKRAVEHKITESEFVEDRPQHPAHADEVQHKKPSS